MHPQLVAQMLGRPLPPQPGDLGTSDVSAIAPTVQAGAGEQSTQAACLLKILRDGRMYRVHCANHGFVGCASRRDDAEALVCEG